MHLCHKIFKKRKNSLKLLIMYNCIYLQLAKIKVWLLKLKEIKNFFKILVMLNYIILQKIILIINLILMFKA
jgi:hypothetical protein